jgi:hypothetical protein
MGDARLQSLAWAKLIALRCNPPRDWDEPTVSQFHDILRDLEAAFGQELGPFRIPNEKLCPQPSGPSRYAGHGRPALPAPMSAMRYCPGEFALRQIEGVFVVLEPLARRRSEPAPPLDERSGAEPETRAESATSIIGPNRPVQLVRRAGSPDEKRFATVMGGDFVHSLFVLAPDQPEIRDEVRCEAWDEPRVINQVEPVVVQHGLSHWVAGITPRSEWRLQHDRREPVQGLLGQSPGRPYPRTMYHTTKQSVTVYSAQEEVALGPDWSMSYIHQSYPKNKYHWDGRNRQVKTLKEEIALGGGWANSPGEFDACKDTRKLRPKTPDPLKWIEEWAPLPLSPEVRKKLRADLLRADSAFWRAPNYPIGTVASMRKAFDGLAEILFKERLLTESILEADLPALVWDSAIAGGWWHLASETPRSIFPEKIGRYWVWLDDSRDWHHLFRAETAEWRAKLLDLSNPAILNPYSSGGSQAYRDAFAEFERNYHPEWQGVGSGSLPPPNERKRRRRPWQPPTLTVAPPAVSQLTPVLPVPAEKGDASILGDKRLVSFGTAERYLGISERQRQKLVRAGTLKIEGQGQNRKITTESLKAYLPPEIPN